MFLCALSFYAQGQTPLDSMHYPLSDRRGDRFTWQNDNPFLIADTSIINQEIEYDPETGQFYISEKIGNIIYRKPTYLTVEEMLKIQSQKTERDYFNERSQTLLDLNRKTLGQNPLFTINFSIEYLV